MHVYFLLGLLMNFLKIFVSVDFDEVKNVFVVRAVVEIPVAHQGWNCGFEERNGRVEGDLETKKQQKLRCDFGAKWKQRPLKKNLGDSSRRVVKTAQNIYTKGVTHILLG